MTPDLYRDILGIPRPSEKSLEIFSNLTIETIDQVNKRLKVGHHRVPDEPIKIINLSLSFYPPDEWESKFTHLRRVAFRFFTTPDTLWTTIAVGLYSPEAGEAYKKLDPSFKTEKYFKYTSTQPAPQKITPHPTPTPELQIQETPEETKPQLALVKKPFSLKIALRLCDDWRLDPRWEKITPCAKLLFCWLIFRTYRKDTIRKIKQALANGETYFPWCCTGIASLSKQLTYQPSSSKRMKHYEACWIKRSLRQLWDLGFIHRIFRGYKDQGAGKYHVFLNPKMSATFNQARVKTKHGATPKKRHSRTT